MIDAVIFDWGGTLTPWHPVDFSAEAQALALAAIGADETAAEQIALANQTVLGWSRDHQRSATVKDIFDAAGLVHDEGMLTAYREFWEPHTLTDPDVPVLFERLRADGVKIGILSNTVWPRHWHETYFDRDGVLHLIDGAVYTSEVPWTKPAPEAFEAAMQAVGANEPGRCVFVGDRLFDDIWGASNYGMKAIHVPHSDIPVEQVGHSEGEPDAVVHRLAEVYDVVATWRQS
ncbi:MAG TPA: HAD family hydrolase, partial [Nocardioidaceae bacterium]|nr:HAD family hydrolase [Nocardioidaceae bacterium]